MYDGSKNGLVKVFTQGLATKIPTKILSFSKSDLKKWRKEMKVSNFPGEYHKKYSSHCLETSRPPISFTDPDTPLMMLWSCCIKITETMIHERAEW
jgi:hypothetical protein